MATTRACTSIRGSGFFFKEILFPVPDTHPQYSSPPISIPTLISSQPLHPRPALALPTLLHPTHAPRRWRLKLQFLSLHELATLRIEEEGEEEEAFCNTAAMNGTSFRARVTGDFYTSWRKKNIIRCKKQKLAGRYSAVEKMGHPLWICEADARRASIRAGMDKERRTRNGSRRASVNGSQSRCRSFQRPLFF